MKKLLGIVVLGLLWSTNSYARFRICSGGSSCDNLILPAALLSLGMSDFLKNNWSDLAFSLVMFFISMYLFSQS